MPDCTSWGNCGGFHLIKNADFCFGSCVPAGVAPGRGEAGRYTGLGNRGEGQAKDTSKRGGAADSSPGQSAPSLASTPSPPFFPPEPGCGLRFPSILRGGRGAGPPGLSSTWNKWPRSGAKEGDS
jgi:hypothetical protein